MGLKKLSLRNRVKNGLKEAAKRFGVGITSQLDLDRLSQARFDLRFLSALPDSQIAAALRHLPKSQSQIRQDLFVLNELNFMRDGFFVEFGAADGVHLSNTYLLEKSFGWTGLLAEPARVWHADLRINRKCTIETRCVWSNSSTILNFKETDEAELSTVAKFTGSDSHKTERSGGLTYDVQSISLLDMLKQHNSPTVIDYLSIDTEGSEFEILNTFDFSAYRFRVITCEHNFTNMRQPIFDLLTRNGYRRKLEEISGFDDWYITS